MKIPASVELKEPQHRLPCRVVTGSHEALMWWLHRVSTADSTSLCNPTKCWTFPFCVKTLCPLSVGRPFIVACVVFFPKPYSYNFVCWFKKNKICLFVRRIVLEKERGKGEIRERENLLALVHSPNECNMKIWDWVIIWVICLGAGTQVLGSFSTAFSGA